MASARYKVVWVMCTVPKRVHMRKSKCTLLPAVNFGHVFRVHCQITAEDNNSSSFDAGKVTWSAPLAQIKIAYLCVIIIVTKSGLLVTVLQTLAHGFGLTILLAM